VSYNLGSESIKNNIINISSDCITNSVDMFTIAYKVGWIFIFVVWMGIIENIIIVEGKDKKCEKVWKSVSIYRKK